MEQMYLHPEDATVIREETDCGGAPLAKLYDCDGEVRYRFPVDWTDAQIMHALAFANLAFRHGVRRGEATKTDQIRQVMGLN